MSKTVRVHTSHFDLNSHKRNGISQPGWVIDDSVILRYAYSRPHEGYTVEVYIDDNKREYMRMVGSYGTGVIRYVRDDGMEWRPMLPGFTYYKHGKPFRQVVTA